MTVVYLDVDSHRALGQDPNGQWDRRLHARLVRRLHAAGATAVVFDVLFDHASRDPEEDLEFARAMREQGRVVLGAGHHESGQATAGLPGIRSESWAMPTPVLMGAAAAVGGAELMVDDDFVVREAARWVGRPEPAGLSWAAVRLVSGEEAEGPRPSGGEWMRYYGGPLSLPYVSYARALSTNEVSDRAFAGKVVFVGAQPEPAAFGERRDELRHPLAAWGERGQFMPAVEVHAMQYVNWVRGDGLKRLDPGLERMAVGLFGVGVGLLLVRLRTLAGAGMTVGLIASVVVVAAGVWWGMGRWFAWLVPAGVLLPGAWGVSMVRHGVRWQRQRARMEAQRAVDRRKIEWQAALIGRAQDAIVVTDLFGRVTYANPAGARAFAAWGVNGASAGVVPFSAFGERRDAVVTRGEWSGVVEVAEAEGRSRVLETRWTPLRDERGRTEAILILASDITERRRLEVDFLRMQKWEAVGSLAGGMAHDLNNRLAPALLGLQLLQESTREESTRRMLTTIETHTRRGAETVRQVLRFLRGGSVEWSEIRPPELVRELEALLLQTFPSTVRIGTMVAPEVGDVRGNATQLQQALLNLCLNARDAMPEGGEITLAVDDVDLTEAEAGQLRGGKPGPYVLFAVTDSGGGIPPEHLGRIFDPLFTTKPEGQGTGLGLPSVARTVEQHGGCLGVTSEVGVGSTFELYLPRVPRDARGATGSRP